MTRRSPQKVFTGMSVQFGVWSLDGSPEVADQARKASTLLTPYAVDGVSSFERAGILIHYLPFHTTAESHGEQPFVSPTGTVFTWDGRLDNRAELLRQIGAELSQNDPDVAIVAAGFRRSETASLANLVGDWALSIWNPVERSLLLARDFLGSRPLYYSHRRHRLTWSTVPDPLVSLDRAPEIDEEYVAGWLSLFPATHRTPFAGLSAVPPSSYVLFRNGTVSTKCFWNFDAGRSVRYGNDLQYEEHFRSLFLQSVGRRLRSDQPVLAELSGGMDSSSIVCVADKLLADGSVATPRLDTVSYYDDDEPNWNERPYFTMVEKQRGKTGCHIDVAAIQRTVFAYDDQRLACLPGSGGHPTRSALEFAACLQTNGNRVLLSGIGGDEVLGGVPTPVPELGDLLARGQLLRFFGQLLAWAIRKRQPVFHLFEQTIRRFLTADLPGLSEQAIQRPWLNPGFVIRHRRALGGYNIRWKIFGPRPSFQENLSTLDGLRRQLSCGAIPLEPRYEKRYPYLDRDLLEFLYAIPRDQLVRPRTRRSLMRRALSGIVPPEILDRKRKAFLVRGTMVSLAEQMPQLLATSHKMASTTLGITSPEGLARTFDQILQRQEINVSALTRMLNLEAWLKHLERCGYALRPKAGTRRTEDSPDPAPSG